MSWVSTRRLQYFFDEIKKVFYHAGNKPTANDVGAVPRTRKVNNKELSSDVTLSASDVNARPSNWMPTAEQVGAFSKTDGENLQNAVGIYNWVWENTDKGNFIVCRIGTVEVARFSQGFVSENFLPLTGGTLSGAMHIKANTSDLLALINSTHNRELLLKVWESDVSFYNFKDGNNFSTLALGKSDSNLPDLLKLGNAVSGVIKEYKVFGEHNKPSGSYTGNGSATSRTIAVGGLGEVLVVTSDIGTAWVSSRGAICMNRETGAISGLKSWEVYYKNGILTIAVTSDFVNKSSQSYWYQVL